MKNNIISVKYEDRFESKTFGGKTYIYYSKVNVSVGDLVIAKTRTGNKIARVNEINIPEERTVNIKPFLKCITQKINKDEYLNSNNIIRENV